MNIPQQIEAISIARAANAAHYEYLATERNAKLRYEGYKKLSE